MRVILIISAALLPLIIVEIVAIAIGGISGLHAWVFATFILMCALVAALLLAGRGGGKDRD